jgi:hypothetical protein
VRVRAGIAGCGPVPRVGVGAPRGTDGERDVEYVLMVDSSADARTIFDAVVRGLGAIPPVWARYLGDGGGAATPLTAQEVDFLHGWGIAVLPVYNDSTLNGSAQGTYQLGVRDAQEAVAQARSLGVPPGVYIVNDVEYDALGRLTGEYLAGWADAMRATAYGGSGIVYGNLTDARFQSAVRAASVLSPSNLARLGFWLASWTATGGSPPPVPSWGDRYGPSSLPQPIQAQTWAWQYAGRVFGDTVDLSLIQTPLPQVAGDGSLWASPRGAVAQPADPADPWAAAAWAKAAARGILDGTRPRDPATREELAVVLDRLGLLG